MKPRGFTCLPARSVQATACVFSWAFLPLVNLVPLWGIAPQG